MTESSSTTPQRFHAGGGERADALCAAEVEEEEGALQAHTRQLAEGRRGDGRRRERRGREHAVGEAEARAVRSETDRKQVAALVSRTAPHARSAADVHASVRIREGHLSAERELLTLWVESAVQGQHAALDSHGVASAAQRLLTLADLQFHAGLVEQPGGPAAELDLEHCSVDDKEPRTATGRAEG